MVPLSNYHHSQVIVQKYTSECDNGFCALKRPIGTKFIYGKDLLLLSGVKSRQPYVVSLCITVLPFLMTLTAAVLGVVWPGEDGASCVL